MGHFEPSPVNDIIGYTNFIRLTHGLRDIKIQLFLDSPDFAKMLFFENEVFWKKAV